MPDAPVVHIGENSPEQVAYRLLQDIAKIEDVSFYRNPDHGQAATREWILTTYAQILEAMGRRHGSVA